MRKSYKSYPPHTIKRSGIKVSWYNFETRELAEKASTIASHNAEVAWNQGYDFGYQSPGKITEEEDGTFTVCVP